MTSSNPVFLDAHATTPVAAVVLEAMLPFFSQHFANPASQHYRRGRHVARAVAAARAAIAALVDAPDVDGLLFCSGATEANNWVLRALSRYAGSAKSRVVTVATEHQSVLAPCRWLATQGVEVTLLPVQSDGRLCLQRLEAALKPDVRLVSVMHCNNEIGVLQPLAAIAELAHAHGAWLHVDAAQGVGVTPLSVRHSHVDYLSLSAHKMYGPKGIGALYAARGEALQALQVAMLGGGQERGWRGGTLNVPGIVGFGAAAALMQRSGHEDAERMRRLRQRLQEALQTRIPTLCVNARLPEAERHPGNLSVSIVSPLRLPLVQAMAPVECAAASACTQGQPSHVLQALGHDTHLAHNSLRFGLHRDTIEADVLYAAERLQTVVEASLYDGKALGF